MITHLRFTGGTKLLQFKAAILIVAFSIFCNNLYADAALNEFNSGNYKKALELWTEELKTTPDSAEVNYNLAILFDKGLGVEADVTVATKYYISAANLDYAPAMFNLGVIMARQKNYTSAAKWWLKASKSQLPEAQYNLAKLYFDGLGVDKDLYKAKYWFKQAAQSAMIKYEALDSIVSSGN